MGEIITDNRQVSILVPAGSNYENVLPKTSASAVSTTTSGKSVQDHIDDSTIHNSTTVIEGMIDTALADYTPTASLAAVATSGDYADLSNKPTIGSATITIQKNSTKVDDFSVNATSAKTINITVPTAVSDLSDASSYYTATQVDEAIATAVTSVYRYKGSVASYSNLPKTGNVAGDVYNVEDTGANYAWKGTDWDKLSDDLTNYVTLTGTQTLTNKTIDLSDNTVIGLANVATSGSYADLSNKPTIGNATITIKKNGTKVEDFTVNATSDVDVDISVPTKLSDLTDDITTSSYSSTGTAPVNGTAVASAISSKQDTIDASHKLSSDLVDDTGHTNKFVTASEKTTWSGKQDAITSSAKLSSDLVDDTNKTHKFVSASEKTTWSGKQDAIADLEDIRSGAAAGATALQPNEAITAATKCKITYDSKGLVTAGADLAASDIPSLTLSKISDVTASAAELNTLDGITASTAELNVLDGITATTTELNYVDGVTSAIQTQIDNKVDKNTAITGATKTKITYDSKGLVTSGADLAASDIPDISATYQTKITSSNKVPASNISGLATVATSGKASDLTQDASNRLVSDSEKTTWSGKQDAIADLEDIRSGAAAGATALQSSDVTDTYSSTGTAPVNGKAVASAISTKADSSSLANYVPTSRTVNSKALSSNITLTASDVGALPDSTSIPTITDTYSSTSTDGMSGKAVASAISNKADSATSLSGYGITDAYTKTEIDGKLSGAMHFKGTKAKVSDLPASGNVTGDMWNVQSTGANYAWDGSAWDKLSENIDLSGYVPTSRTINSKALSGDISLTASDVGAAASSHSHPTSDITALTGYEIASAAAAIASTDTLNQALGKLQKSIDGKQASGSYVTTSRTINSKALSSDITLTASDVGAAATSHTHTSGDVTALTGYTIASAAASISATDTLNQALGKLQKSIDGKQASGSYVTTSTTINSKALSSNITLTASDVGALPDSTTIPTITDTYSSTSTDGMSGKAVASALSSYVPTSRTINSKALSSNITLSASDVGAAATSHNQASNTINAMTGYDKSAGTATGIVATDTLNVALAKIEQVLDTKQGGGSYVPTSRKVNNKALSSDITLTASDVGALPDSTIIPTITDTYSGTSSDGMSGKAVASALGSYVPTSRTVNSKALSSNITLTASDVGAAATSHTHVTSDVTALTGYEIASAASAIAATDSLNTALGKLQKSIDGKQASGSYVPTSRTVNSKALSSNITLTASDVGALPDSTSIPTITDTYSSTSTDGMSGKAVASAISNKADSATSLSGYGITDAYTKTEIDGKLSGAMHFKGTKASVSNLPTTGNTQGDMWNVTDTGANYAWDGSAWDKLSENVDLSGYVPTSRKVNNKALSGDISLTASDVGAAASSHSHTSADVTALTGYTIASSASAVAATDTLNQALGKLQKSIDGKQASGSYVTTSTTVNNKALSSNITLTASDVGALPDSTTIPTITDTYSATSSDGMSGKAVASAVSGKVTANTAITGATKCKITYDSKGLVTSGADLAASDIPDISATYQTKITSTNKISADNISDGSTNKMVTSTEKTTWSGKQDALVSGTNIKTINNNSILGSGNLTISASKATSSSLGTVKPDNTTITIDSAGTISAVQDTMTMVVDEFTMAASGTTISLTSAPASKSLCWVNIANTDIVSSEWSLSGSTITLNTAIEAGMWGQVRYFTNVGGVTANSPLLKAKSSISSGALTLQASKKYYETTVAGNTTFTITAPSTSDVIEFYLHITHTSGTITFPSSVKWASTPSFTVGKKHLIKMLSFDGGSTYLAQLEGSFS